MGVPESPGPAGQRVICLAPWIDRVNSRGPAPHLDSFASNASRLTSSSIRR